MARESKIAHDYFLDCCKKYGVEVVSDRKVRSHYETTVKYNGYEYTEKSLSIYGQFNDKKLGMFTFKGFMSAYYLDMNDVENTELWLHGLHKVDILKEEKPKESDLIRIYKLLDKALTIANESDKDNVPDDVLKAVSDAVGIVFPYLKRRGEL